MSGAAIVSTAPTAREVGSIGPFPITADASSTHTTRDGANACSTAARTSASITADADVVCKNPLRSGVP